jgi:hypothetical protein
MANPASLTINTLTRDASIQKPAAQTIDTNGTVNVAGVGSESERLWMELVNSAAQAITVTAKAGVNPPAIRQGLGDLAVTCAATGSGAASQILGPFEPARFVKGDGTIDINFQAASGSPNLAVIVYRVKGHPVLS